MKAGIERSRVSLPIAALISVFHPSRTLESQAVGVVAPRASQRLIVPSGFSCTVPPAAADV